MSCHPSQTRIQRGELFEGAVDSLSHLVRVRARGGLCLLGGRLSVVWDAAARRLAQMSVVTAIPSSLCLGVTCITWSTFNPRGGLLLAHLLLGRFLVLPVLPLSGWPGTTAFLSASPAATALRARSVPRLITMLTTTAAFWRPGPVGPIAGGPAAAGPSVPSLRVPLEPPIGVRRHLGRVQRTQL